MARSRAAQAIKVQEVTHASSIELACSLLQVGVADICHARGILSDEDFVNVKIQGLDRCETKSISSAEDASDEAKTISQWISVSARDALESGYATKMIFGFASDSDCRTILEEYVFMFKYDESGNIHLDGMAGGNSKKRSTTKGAKPDVLSARKQVYKLLRAIISITRTLESVPDERYVFCKMEFSDNCPEDYQPPGFVDAGDRSVGFFSSKPFAMKLGGVTTPYHNIALGLRTVLDSVDMEHDNRPMGDDVSYWDTTEGSAGDEHGSQDENLEPQLRGHTNDDLADLFSEPQETAPSASAPKQAPGDEATERMLSLRLNEAPLPSLAGGIHSVPGSECTHSIAPAVGAAPAKPTRKSGRAAAATSAKKNNPMDCDGEAGDPDAKAEAHFWPQSQVSGDVGKKRKVSIVERPVHQDLKRLRRAVVETQEDPTFAVPAPPPAKAAAAPPKRKSLRTTKRKFAANEH